MPLVRPCKPWRRPSRKDKTKQDVYDMVGNLRELCADAYVPYSDPKFAGHTLENPLVDKREPVDLSSAETKIVVRGGSFMYAERSSDGVLSLLREAARRSRRRRLPRRHRMPG